MKPAAFGYARPGTVDEAARILASEPGAKVIAGGQTLGPMLNLRLARPSMLVDISRIAELTAVRDDGSHIVIGACVTHAAIEDGRVPDVTNGFLPHVASGIAYRAVRNRGTIGGSLAHADPAADWLSALAVLTAQVEIAGPSSRRRLDVGRLVTGAMTTVLEADELIVGVRVRKLRSGVRWGYHKICRKAGEFAEAIGAVIHHGPTEVDFMAVAGATGAAPLFVLNTPKSKPSIEGWRHALSPLQSRDAYELQLHAVALQRAHEQAMRR